MHDAVGFFCVCSSVIEGIIGGFCCAGGVSCARTALPPISTNSTLAPASVRRMAQAMLFVRVLVLPRSRLGLSTPRPCASSQQQSADSSPTIFIFLCQIILSIRKTPAVPQGIALYFANEEKQARVS
jgi:hypothetical protein